MDTLSVTVNILGRKYKLKVNGSEEQYLRKAAEMIDQQAKQYGKVYAQQDGQDLLAMAALTQITNLVKNQERQEYLDTGLEQRLVAIDALLDRHIAEG
jgi:cell division protein ZapA (FtsZ GTPase activity inhibitor)